MRTNTQTTKTAFNEWFNIYMKERTHEERIDELELIFENNDCSYYENFMASKRVKAHSGAFYSVMLAIKPFLPKGYYASNLQVKALISEFFAMDYKDFLADLVERLENSRNEILAQ